MFPVIPGETPIDDLSGLKIKGITTRRELNVFEAQNVNKAAQKYLLGQLTRRSARFDVTWCLKLHKEMFGKVWQWAGQPRTQNLNIGLPWQHVGQQLHALLEDMKVWQFDAIEQSALLHHRATQIHPFLNGNGRWSRMLANIWLRLGKQAIVSWPETTLGETSTIRDAYLNALRLADTGDCAALIQLHRRHQAQR